MSNRKKLKNPYAQRTGVLFRSLRDHLGWTQEYVAITLGKLIGNERLSQSSLQRIEDGSAGSDLFRIVKLAEVYQADPLKVIALIISPDQPLKSVSLENEVIKDLLLKSD